MYYSDKHVAWDYPGSEYTTCDGKRFIKMLDEKGYFAKENTVSFEMRPIDGMSAEESLDKWVKAWKAARNIA